MSVNSMVVVMRSMNGVWAPVKNGSTASMTSSE